MEPQQAARLNGANEEVLGLVCATLQNDVGTICAALCTSSSARRVILSKCSGILHMQVDAAQLWRRLEHRLLSTADSGAEVAALVLQRITAQTAWLAQYGGLVGQLQLRSACDMKGVDETVMQACIAVLRPALQLQRLQLHVIRPHSLLKQLVASRLTSLEMLDDDDCDGAASPLLVAALGKFTGLHQLSVTGQWYPAHDSLASAVAGMIHLTHLQLQPQLPVTALQQLLSQLVELQLASPQCDAAQLVTHIKAMQQLQSLTLVYNVDAQGNERYSAHATVWAAIPCLRQLDLEVYKSGGGEMVSSAVADGIAATTQLTRLYAWLANGATAGVDAVAMLSPLKHLQSLDFMWDGYMGDNQHSFGQLFSHSLTRLISLYLTVGASHPLALAQVCLQATQLTQLALTNAQVGETGLQMIASSMTQLRQLALCDCGLEQVQLLAAVMLPSLPSLEQLTYICDDLQRQEAAQLISSMWHMRPTVKFLAFKDRDSVFEGHVGAYCYV